MIGESLTVAEEQKIARDLEGTCASDEFLAEEYPHRKPLEILEAANRQGVVRCEECKFFSRIVNDHGECIDCQQS